MSLIIDLREAAAAIEADFSHLWVEPDTRRWYRPGSIEPIIDPDRAPYFIRIQDSFVPIKDLTELPDTDIFNSTGLLIPRSMVTTLSNVCGHPVRGLNLVQRSINSYILSRMAHKPYTLSSVREWYEVYLLRPNVQAASFVPPGYADENPNDVIWNMLLEHWMKLLEYTAEIEQLVRDYVAINPWCKYQIGFRHTDLLLDRGPDIRVEFYERYSYLTEDIQKLHNKVQEEKGFTFTQSK